MKFNRILSISVLSVIVTASALIFAFDQVETQNVSNGSAELIEAAYIIGTISSGDKIFYNLQSMMDPDHLPDEFRSSEPGKIRSGTPFINEALDHWDLMTAAQQDAASTMLARPETDSLYISPEGHFAIHYEIGTIDGVPPEDLDNNEVPDFVERIGVYADSSYRQYQINLGYYPPPDDGDGMYDIYLLHIGNYYGGTIREGAGDSSWADYQSYIKMHNDFSFAHPNDDPEGTIIGAQKVTTAHEYFHATQLAYAYKAGKDLWWTEGTAVFFENDMFDEANDHYSYLPYFFNYPDTFLIDTSSIGSSYHNYSTFVWPEFLVKKYGIEVIRIVWEYLRYYDPLESMDSVLTPFGSNVEDEFPEFTVWNYFTGNRYDPDFHYDGFDYPLIVVDPVVPSCPFTDVPPTLPPDGLASNYVMSYPDSSNNGMLVIKFDGDNTVGWGFSYIIFKGETKQVFAGCEVDYRGRTDCGIYDFIQYDSLLFIPCVVSQWHDDNGYSFTTVIQPFGDVDGTGEINILDVTHIIKFLYKNGMAPKYDLWMGDVDGDGNTNILDASYLIYYLYRDGPEPCVYRP